MGITFINPKKALNTVFYKLPVLESEIQKLSKNLGIYIKSAKEGESEEYHKGLIKDFFANTWYSPSYSVNTNGREDLVIFNGNDTSSKPAVIIEAKSPSHSPAGQTAHHSPNTQKDYPPQSHQASQPPLPQ